jgi:hypothetical protein
MIVVDEADKGNRGEYQIDIKLRPFSSRRSAGAVMASIRPATTKVDPATQGSGPGILLLPILLANELSAR